MFTVPMLSILEKTVQEFYDEGVRDNGVIQGQHHMQDIHAKLQIASVQTLARRTVPEFDLVFVDECHVKSSAIVKMMETQPKCRFVGLSATPWRKGMADEWDHLCVCATTKDLIELGWRTDFRIFAPDIPDRTGAEIVAGDITEEAAEKMMRPVVGNIVGKWLELGDNQPTLGFAPNRVSAKNMQERFQNAGIAAGYIDGYTDDIEEAKTLRDFKDGNIKVLWSVQKLIAGVDLDIGCIIDAAPTMSEIRLVQKYGRGRGQKRHLGDSEGRVIVIDHAGNTNELGFVTDIHHEKFVSGKPTEAETR
jgi:superfamily II DNA or RNA helicase